MAEKRVNVLIIGAGPAGLSAALRLVKLGVKDIWVIDRESAAGGMPRLCHHTGFGVRDLRWLFTGPDYANRYYKKAKKAGVGVQLNCAVTGWVGDKTLQATSAAGIETLHANAVLLATGCRERPRAAQLVPGSRPQGVFTTGSLQDFIHGYNMPVGNQAVIIGSELVSYSAIHTLRKGHCKPTAMVTEHAHPQVYFPYLPYKWWSADIFRRVPLIDNSQIVRIVGREKVSAVEIATKGTSEVKTLACDAVVFTGNWIPEQEIARLGRLEMNPATKGPVIDTQYRTSKEAVFAAGNLLRGAEPADAAALEGRHAADSIQKYLESGVWPANGHAVAFEGAIQWLVPSVVKPDDMPLRNHFLFRVNKFLENQILAVIQNGNVLYRKVYGKLGPNYSYKLGGNWISKLTGDGEIMVTLSSKV